MKEPKEFIDEETGIKIAFEPEPLDPNRVTAYAPDDADRLTTEQMNAALHRLMEKMKTYLEQR